MHTPSNGNFKLICLLSSNLLIKNKKLFSIRASVKMCKDDIGEEASAAWIASFFWTLYVVNF